MRATETAEMAANAESEATAAAAPGVIPAGHGPEKGLPSQPKQEVPLPPQTPHQSYSVGGRVSVGGRPSQPRQEEPLPPQTPQMSTTVVQTEHSSFLQ